MLLAVAGPARGRSHTSKSGSDSSDVYGYYDSRYYHGYDNSSSGAFGSIFDECDDTDDRNNDLSIIHYLSLVLFPFLLLQGIIGNVLAIPALLKISRSAWSTILYLGCLGVTDLIILMVQCGDAWYQEVVKSSLSKKIVDSSDAACKTYYFSFMCVKHLNPWIIVAIAIEMMITIRWPKRTYFMCTLERARNVLMLVSIVVVCLDINHFWTFGVPKPGMPCIYLEDFSENFKDWVWPTMDMAVELVMPLVAVSVCFFFTAAAMIQRSANQKRDLEAEMTKYFLELSTLKDFLNICFIVCLLFICLNTCRVTYNLTMIMSTLGHLDVDCFTLRIFKTFDVTFAFLFYSSKIYLYCSFSSMFRTKLKEGFVKACSSLQNCCRVCSCGQKWTPVPTRDKTDDIRLVQGPGRSRVYDQDSITNSNKPTDTFSKNDINKPEQDKDQHRTAHGRNESNKIGQGKVETTGKDHQELDSNKAPNTTNRRSTIGSKGSNQPELSAHKA